MIGTVINGRYRIVAEIGEGGMASVFEAVDLRLQRDVAIKILHPHIAKHDEFCKRFHQEAAIAAKLVHANIVQIHDYGTSEDGRTFIVSELIRGQDFHRMQVERLRTAEKPFSPIFCALICEEILKALEVAHRQNFIHRDVKPDNVMISEDGCVKLTDFGIAKNGTSTMTVAGHFLGSPVYSSPEQVQGEPVDFRSDLFALGIILYEAVTGTLPFTGKNASEVMMRIVQGVYPSPSEILIGLPQELEQIIQRALTSQRNGRFDSTGAMREAVRAFLSACGIENSRAGLESYFQDPSQFLRRHERIYQERLLKTAPSPVARVARPPVDQNVNHDLRRASTGKRITHRSAPHGRKTVVGPKRHTRSVPRRYHMATSGTKKILLAMLSAAVLSGAMGASLVWPEFLSSVKKMTLSRLAPLVATPVHLDAPLPPVVISQNTPQEAPTAAPRTTVEPRPVLPSVIGEPKKVAAVQRTVTPPKRRDEPKTVVSTPKSSGEPSFVSPAPTIIPSKPVTGRVTIQTIPANAPLAINGKPMGTSGIEGQVRTLELRPGTHVLTIASTEIGGIRYGSVEKKVSVEPGKQVSLGTLKLVPYRMLTVFIAGAGVVVRINGDPYPITGKPISLSLPEGKVEIKARAANGKTFERVVNLRGENLTLNTSLE